MQSFLGVTSRVACVFGKGSCPPKPPPHHEVCGVRSKSKNARKNWKLEDLPLREERFGAMRRRNNAGSSKKFSFRRNIVICQPGRSH